jgi:uncharacterized protein
LTAKAFCVNISISSKEGIKRRVTSKDGPFLFQLNREAIMAGTKDGGRKAAATNKNKYGSEFYAKIGAMGGRKGTTGGFYANRELARVAGARGGRISRRGKSAGKSDVA